MTARPAVFALLALAVRSTPPRPPNLFSLPIADLRTQVGAYGESRMITPNLDRFASTVRLFERPASCAHPCRRA